MGAMPGVLEVPGGSGGLEVSPWAAGFGEFSLKSQVPKFSWLVELATVVDGSQDRICWAISLAIRWVASFCWKFPDSGICISSETVEVNIARSELADELSNEDCSANVVKRDDVSFATVGDSAYPVVV
jgi:hypothetical protein